MIACKVIIDADGLKPAQLVVTLTCKRTDASIVGSKLVWKELNCRACVVDALGPSTREGFPDAPMCIVGA